MTKPLTGTVHALLKAIDVLEKDGWCQGSMHDERGRYCILGALHLHRDGCSAAEAVETWAVPYCYGLARWNDAPERTKEEVLAALRKTLAREIEG